MPAADKAPADKPAATPAKAPEWAVDEIRLSNGRMHWQDESTVRPTVGDVEQQGTFRGEGAGRNAHIGEQPRHRGAQGHATIGATAAVLTETTASGLVFGTGAGGGGTRRLNALGRYGLVFEQAFHASQFALGQIEFHLGLAGPGL